MNVLEKVKKELMIENNKYSIESEDNYDFWKEHVKYVVDNAKMLAKKYNADLEIVELAALLHDIALITKTGARAEHHITGAEIAENILFKYNYPKDKTAKIKQCVLNHRSSKNAESIEELCVADADILAHFDNIPMLFNSAFVRNKISLSNVKSWLKEVFEKDYNDLSDKTKEEFKDKYKQICKIVLGE